MSKIIELRRAGFIRANVPSVPNYIILENDSQMDVADLTDDQVNDIAAAWKEALKKNAFKRRMK